MPCEEERLTAAGAAASRTITIGKDAKGKPVELPMSGALSGALRCLHDAACGSASVLRQPRCAGIGTWQYNNSVAEAAVGLALSLGYTHIDTAIGYDNQEGIARALKASSRPRSSYFLTSKIPGGLSQSDAMEQLEQSIQQLGVDFVDMMLVHFPATWGGKGGKAMRQAGWKALEDFYKAGKARAIGVSHFCESHIADVLEVATVTPAVNQVYAHFERPPIGPLAHTLTRCRLLLGAGSTTWGWVRRRPPA